MSTKRSRGWVRWAVIVCSASLAGVAVAVSLKRQSIEAWYCTLRLQHADEATRGDWIARTVRLHAEALPPLLRCLRSDDERACANAGAALLEIATDRTQSPDQTRAMAEQIADAYSRLSSRGRSKAMGVVHAVLDVPGKAIPPTVVLAALSKVLSAAAQAPEPTLRREALRETERILSQHDPLAAAAVEEVLQAAMRDREPANRAAAVRLAGKTGNQLIPPAKALLKDPVPEVRRQALATVGAATECVQTDDLLPWLHDPDPDVRAVCEEVLRGRGLSDADLRPARLLTDPTPARRLQLVDYLRTHRGLDAAVWLRHLSQDEAPAVRAAAIRAAVNEPSSALRQRLQQISQADPSPTVRSLAVYYLSYLDRREPRTEAH